MRREGAYLEYYPQFPILGRMSTCRFVAQTARASLEYARTTYISLPFRADRTTHPIILDANLRYRIGVCPNDILRHGKSIFFYILHVLIVRGVSITDPV